MIMRISLYVLLFLFQSIIANAQNFSVEKTVSYTPVKDQCRSGTCWSFAATSFIESELIRLGYGKQDLSEMFFVRKMYEEKATMHVRMQGKNFLTQGGQPHDVFRAITRYGFLPEEAYPGVKNSLGDYDHMAFFDSVADYLKPFAREDSVIREPWIIGLSNRLDKAIGPLNNDELNISEGHAYQRQFPIFNPADYVHVTSYYHHPFFKNFILEDKYNWSLSNYFNLPLDDFTRLVDTALRNGYSVCWNGDVSEPGFDFNKGMATVRPQPSTVTDRYLRQRQFEDHSTTIDHVMHLVGLARDKNNTRYYIIKNSWGEQNLYGGMMFMSDEYFRQKTVSFMVHKNMLKKIYPAYTD